MPLITFALSLGLVTRAPAPGRGAAEARRKFVLGLNQYSHDAGVCLLSTDGEVSVTVPKERVTRVKHDAGDVATSVHWALEAAGAQLEDVVAVCANNHHHRIAPFESRLPWSVELGIYPRSCLSPHNLLPGVPKHELSHHLAHAWSVVAQAPFDEGLVVVMDGMGETRQAMRLAADSAELEYSHDLGLPDCEAGFVEVPREFGEHVGYREAETVYSFRREAGAGDGIRVARVFKRWSEQRSPPELYNHGFENLESLGALYSRVSSHVFGDWNACGKVMGLAPWEGRWCARGGGARPRLLSGSLEGHGDDALTINWDHLTALPHANGFSELMRRLGDAALKDGEGGGAALRREDAEARDFYTSLASDVQREVEDAALAFLRRLRERTGQKNVILVGGVALNSVLNGRAAREAGFENVFIPPAPGDEGIATGCAAFALHQVLPRLGLTPPPARASPWPAYQGREYGASEVDDAVDEFSPWIVEEERPRDDAELIERAVQALHSGEIIALADGRSELGARALGHRSILADPRRSDTHARVNRIKQREQWRPLAPSALAEEAPRWFEGVPACGSPYMSLTAHLNPDARAAVPAVAHVDGSARLQTVSAADAPFYHALIAAFFVLAGVPLVLNTSFNLAGMPIVESPADALSCFLDADDDLSILVLFGRIIRRRAFPADDAAAAATPRQQRAFVSRCAADPQGNPLRAEVLMDDAWTPLTDALELEVLERCDGEASSREIAARLADESGGEVSLADVLERLRRLYKRRLVSME